MTQMETVTIKKSEEFDKEEKFGQFSRRVYFSPQTSGNSHLKMAYLDVPPGAKGTPHVHLGEEVVYTISGAVRFMVNGKAILLKEGSVALIPADLPHPAQVVSAEPWRAIGVFCDECQILKKALGKEDTNYPLDVGATPNRPIY